VEKEEECSKEGKGRKKEGNRLTYKKGVQTADGRDEKGIRPSDFSPDLHPELHYLCKENPSFPCINNEDLIVPHVHNPGLRSRN